MEAILYIVLIEMDSKGLNSSHKKESWTMRPSNSLTPYTTRTSYHALVSSVKPSLGCLTLGANLLGVVRFKFSAKDTEKRKTLTPEITISHIYLILSTNVLTLCFNNCVT